MNAVTPTGTLTKKIHDQLRADVRMPPMSTPAAAPKPPTAPQTPKAMLRSLPSVKVVERIDSAAGVITAAPRPWNARAAISEASDQARPARSDEIVKTTMPIRKMRRRPSRSAARPPRSRNPPNTSAYALITHCRFSCENPRSVWIDGSATFTTAMSRTTMNCTALNSASANHFLRSELTMSSRCLPHRRLGKVVTRRVEVRFSAPMDWFVVNAREARWLDNETFGAYTRFEPDGERFAQVGIGISVLQPGQPMALYHGEHDQEDFLVLSGRARLLIEGQERSLRQWDFVHCPPWTEHIIIGSGNGPCAVLAVGARAHDGIVYPVSELAVRHGAGADEEHRRGAEGKAGESPYAGYPKDRETSSPL